jgi:hypothetical protein
VSLLPSSPRTVETRTVISPSAFLVPLLGSAAEVFGWRTLRRQYPDPVDQQQVGSLYYHPPLDLANACPASRSAVHGVRWSLRSPIFCPRPEPDKTPREPALAVEAPAQYHWSVPSAREGSRRPITDGTPLPLPEHDFAERIELWLCQIGQLPKKRLPHRRVIVQYFSVVSVVFVLHKPF